MKSNEAPEKIYIPNNSVVISAAYSSKTSFDDVEYISKDAFIEKACAWLENNLQGIVGESIYIEDFKNAMEGE